MTQNIASMSIVVRDYDEAIQWYCGVLGFTLVEDTPLTDTKRWVRVAPAESSDFTLLLARAVTPEQSSRIGNQTGGRVFLFLNTDNFWRD
ncbi:VOC family protein [Occallatibacter riparius]|uniref:VOC family protein n=1 Tax=Occallatibacter riparius TaxID=1002689 RepID=A0A9J7BHV4_9BACT|nr:VOC family protein [Occallatibacter riparius]UWZ82376.1 VOC family protein [Occallatibacter riparius]